MILTLVKGDRARLYDFVQQQPPHVHIQVYARMFRDHTTKGRRWTLNRCDDPGMITAIVVCPTIEVSRALEAHLHEAERQKRLALVEEAREDAEGARECLAKAEAHAAEKLPSLPVCVCTDT